MHSDTPKPKAYETTGGDFVQLRKSFEDDFEAAQNVLELLGRVTEKDTVDDIARAIVEGVRELLGFDRAGLFLWDGLNGCFRGTFGTDVNGQTKDEHDLFWKAAGWPSTGKIERGDVFIEEELDQPPPRPGEENLKAYMVVLRFGAKVYGILSVDNRVSRRIITQQELEYLTLFSRILGNAVDISRIKTQLEEQNKQFQRELQLAQKIQLGFLPRRFPREDALLFQASYNPCALLGGDLYDVFEIDPDNIALYVADIAGHGVGAALISALFKMAVTTTREQMQEHAVGERVQPDRIMHQMASTLAEEMPDEEFLTIVLGVYHVPSQTFRFANGGHEPPFVIRGADHEIIACEMKSGGAIGLVDAPRFPVTELKMHSGDRLLFYTDGVPEAMNAQFEEFGEKRFLDVVKQHASAPLNEILNGVRDAVRRHRGMHPPSDDVTLLGVEIL